MLRALHILRVTPALALPFFHDRSQYDRDNLSQTKENDSHSGYERLKQMYSMNEYDEISVELHSVGQATLTGAFVGACMGGFLKSREAYLYFIETNQATIFQTTMDAKKKLQNYVTVAFAKGATFWGWRLAMFTGAFSIISTTMSVYSGDTSIIDYTVAGAVTGAMYKAHLGLVATCVGFGLGAVLSTIAGAFIVLILKISGFSMEDIRKALHKIKESREDQFHQAKEKAATIKNDEITKHHDHFVEQKGVKKLDDI